MYYIAQQYNKVERENCYDTSDSAVVGELPVTTFDNALGLSEAVDLCLTLQHHLVLCKQHTGMGRGRRTSSAMVKISEPGLLYIREFANMRYTSL
jgi:hypothetical protein